MNFSHAAKLKMLWGAPTKVNAGREALKFCCSDVTIPPHKKGGTLVTENKEISQIREEEVQRGRRPKHSAEKDRRRRLKSLLLTALYKANRGLFHQVLIDLGQKPGSSEYEKSMKMYEDYQREKH